MSVDILPLRVSRFTILAVIEMVKDNVGIVLTYQAILQVLVEVSLVPELPRQL